MLVILRGTMEASQCHPFDGVHLRVLHRPHLHGRRNGRGIVCCGIVLSSSDCSSAQSLDQHRNVESRQTWLEAVGCALCRPRAARQSPARSCTKKAVCSNSGGMPDLPWSAIRVSGESLGWPIAPQHGASILRRRRRLCKYSTVHRLRTLSPPAAHFVARGLYAQALHEPVQY